MDGVPEPPGVPAIPAAGAKTWRNLMIGEAEEGPMGDDPSQDHPIQPPPPQAGGAPPKVGEGAEGAAVEGFCAGMEAGTADASGCNDAHGDAQAPAAAEEGDGGRSAATPPDCAEAAGEGQGFPDAGGEQEEVRVEAGDEAKAAVHVGGEEGCEEGEGGGGGGPGQGALVEGAVEAEGGLGCEEGEGGRAGGAGRGPLAEGAGGVDDAAGRGDHSKRQRKTPVKFDNSVCTKKRTPAGAKTPSTLPKRPKAAAGLAGGGVLPNSEETAPEEEGMHEAPTPRALSKGPRVPGTSGRKEQRGTAKRETKRVTDAVSEWKQHVLAMQPGGGDEEAPGGALEAAFEAAQVMLACRDGSELLEGLSPTFISGIDGLALRLHAVQQALLRDWEDGGVHRQGALHAVCCTMCVVRLSAAGLKKCPSGPGFGTAMDLLSKVLSSVAAEGTPVGKTPKRSKFPEGGSPLALSAAEDALSVVPEIVSSKVALDDTVVIKVTRAGIDALSLPPSAASAHQCGVQVLVSVFARYEQHRVNVLAELFHLGIEGDGDQQGARGKTAAKTVQLEGCPRAMPLVHAAILYVIQGLVEDEGCSEAHLALEGPVKKCSMYLFSLFEQRFEARSQQKGAVKDADAKNFLSGLADSILSVLNLPHFPVAEMLIFHMIDRLEHIAKLDGGTSQFDGAAKLSDFYRSAVVELLCSILHRLAKHRKGAAEQTAVLSALSPVALLDEGTGSGTGGASAKGGVSVVDQAELVTQLEAQQQEFVVQYAGNDSETSLFLSPIKRAISSQNREDLLEQQSKQLIFNSICSGANFRCGSIAKGAFLFTVAMWCSGSDDAQHNGDFWWSQGQSVVSHRYRVSSIPLVSKDYIEAACLRLALGRPLLSQLSSRFSALLPITREVRPVDRVKILKCISTVIPIEASLVHSNIIATARDKYVCDRDNANVRGAAVDLLAASVLHRMVVGANCTDDFLILCDRSIDASLSVRMSVLSFFRELCKWERGNANVVAAANGGEPDRRYTVGAALRVATMLRQNEKSLQTGAVSFFLDLWFDGNGIPSAPIEDRVEEMVIVVGKCCEKAPQEETGTEWLSLVLASVDVAACGEVAEALTGKLSSVLDSEAQNPRFETRTDQLLPVLSTLTCLARAFPYIVQGKLRVLKPLLTFKDMSGGHLKVLRVLLELVEAALSDSKMPSADLQQDLCMAFSDGAFKITDPKRFTNIDDMCKAVKCFGVIVTVFQAPQPRELLTNMLEQQLNFLKVYLSKPNKDLVAWVPRCLIVAGALVRYADANLLPSPSKELALAARSQLFSICMSHYVNHKSDSVRRCAMHALGSICVRQPDVMLQEPCTKLFRRCLQKDTTPALRSQVLRNLHDHFKQEDVRLAELLASASPAAGEDGSKSVVSDRSTMLIHAFHAHILEAALSDDKGVRVDGVSLILIIMKNGLTASYLCLPYLFAQQRYPSSIAGRISMTTLREVHEKETSTYTASVMWDGVVKAFGLKAASDDTKLPPDAFADAFSLLAGTGKVHENKAVRSLLKAAMSRFEKMTYSCGQFAADGTESIPRKLEHAGYIVSFLAGLPFVTIDGPLFVMHLANTIATTLGQRCMDALMEACESEEVVGHGIRAEGTCLGLVLALSVHLKGAYGIKADRVRKFSDKVDTLDSTAVKERENCSMFDPQMLFVGDGDVKVDKKEVDQLERMLQSSMCSDTQPSREPGEGRRGQGGRGRGFQKRAKPMEFGTGGRRKKKISAKGGDDENSDADFDGGGSVGGGADRAVERNSKRRRSKAKAKAEVDSGQDSDDVPLIVPMDLERRDTVAASTKRSKKG